MFRKNNLRKKSAFALVLALCMTISTVYPTISLASDPSACSQVDASVAVTPAAGTTLKLTQSMIKKQYKGDATKAFRGVLAEAEKKATEKKPVTVKVEAGTYVIEHTVILPSNTTLDITGCTIKRNKKSATHNIFRCGTYKEKFTERGYCYQNISLISTKGKAVIDNIWAKNTCLKFCHAKNVNLTGITVKHQNNGHLMEVAAIDGLHLTRCTFQDQKLSAPSDDSESTKLTYEAIQLDVLVPEHLGGYVYEALPCSNVTLDNCKFKNVPRGIGSHTAIQNAPFNNITIENCTFTNCGSIAIQSLNWNHVKINNNTITGSPRGIAIYSVRKSGAGTYLPSIFTSKGLKVDKSLVYNNKKYSDKYAAKTCTNKDIQITNNTITTSGLDLYADYARVAIYVGGQELTAKTGQASDLSGKVPKGNYYVKDVTIRDNTIHTVAHGIRTEDARNLSICNNQISFHDTDPDESYYGIQLRLKSQATEISGNTILNAPSNAIYLNTESYAARIDNNILPDAGKNAIDLESGKADLICENVITNPTLNGIMLLKQAEAESVEKNTIESPAKYGIDVENAAVGNLMNNTIMNSASNGIMIFKGSTAGAIEGNEVVNAEGYGISLTQEVSVTRIKGNMIINPSRNGIMVIGQSEGGDITENTVNGSGKHGIAIENAFATNILNNLINNAGGHGIRLSGTSTVGRIAGNVVDGNEGKGVSVSVESSVGTME